MTVYHIEMKKDGSTFQFVSTDISEKAMFRWAYEHLANNPTGNMIVYYPTQVAGSKFKLYNELGRIKRTQGKTKFFPQYQSNGGYFLVTPKGDLVREELVGRRY